MQLPDWHPSILSLVRTFIRVGHNGRQWYVVRPERLNYPWTGKRVIFCTDYYDAHRTYARSLVVACLVVFGVNPLLAETAADEVCFRSITSSRPIRTLLEHASMRLGR